MLRLLSALLGLLTAAAVAGFGLLVLVLEPAPLVDTDAELRPAELRSFAAVVRARGLESAGVKALTLTPAKLDAVVDLAARRLGGHARLRPGQGGAALAASFPLGREPGPGPGRGPGREPRWANLRVELRETAGIPAVAAARLGGLPLPAALVNRLLHLGLEELAPAGELLRVHFTPDEVRVLYRLRGDAKTAAVALLSDAERRRLGQRQAQLAAVVARQHRAGHVSLAPLLSGLLAEPTAVPGAGDHPDPVADNRAALLVLAAYVNNRRLPVTSAAVPERRRVVLRGRHDLAQHFSISAATAAKGGSPLSHLVGLAKELADADGGSGFSFPDMLANRAGIHFAELATGTPDGARHVRRMARAGRLSESDIMPSPAGLPEGMQESELARTIGMPSSAAYARLIDHIDRRIEATRLHRSTPSG